MDAQNVQKTSNTIKWDTKIFDGQLTTNELYKWDGSDKGADGWRRRVRDYVIGRCYLLKPIMDWAETMEYSMCTDEMIMAKYAECMNDVGEDIFVLARHLWSWLRMCLSGTALSAFRVAPEFNGLDAWRMVTGEVNKGRAGRIIALRGSRPDEPIYHEPPGV